jgi:hypothetical protein
VSFVFLGSATGIASGGPTTAAAVLESDQAGSGFYAAGAGDVNGDGYGDVIVGAAGYDHGETDEGAAFVFLGSASGIASGNPSSPGVTRLESNQPSSAFGASVAGAGDVNGDGYADVIVGAPGYYTANPNGGAAFVFLGSASGVANGSPATAATVLVSNLANDVFGSSVAGAGDVNGDGYADVIVGSPGHDVNYGRVSVFLGSASGIPSGDASAGAVLFGSLYMLFGASVGTAGDVNGDGYADVIVGAPRYSAEPPGSGAAWVYLGSAAGIAGGDSLLRAAGRIVDQHGIELGRSVAGAGDVNGDGYADMIVGDWEYYDGEYDEGAALVVLGNGKGRPVLARQRRGNGSGVAVPPWGLAQSTTGFAAELRATHPQGTGRVKAQLQACPPGVPFGNGSCTNALTPTWIAVNGATPEVLLSQTFSGLVNHTLYRWRARILQIPKTGPIPTNPAHGPWRRFGAQSVEADIRLPEPGMSLAVMAGAALVAALARRQRARRC